MNIMVLYITLKTFVASFITLPMLVRLTTFVMVYKGFLNNVYISNSPNR